MVERYVIEDPSHSAVDGAIKGLPGIVGHIQGLYIVRANMDFIPEEDMTGMPLAEQGELLRKAGILPDMRMSFRYEESASLFVPDRTEMCKALWSANVLQRYLTEGMHPQHLEFVGNGSFSLFAAFIRTYNAVPEKYRISGYLDLGMTTRSDEVCLSVNCGITHQRRQEAGVLELMTEGMPEDRLESAVEWFRGLERQDC